MLCSSQPRRRGGIATRAKGEAQPYRSPTPCLIVPTVSYPPCLVPTVSYRNRFDDGQGGGGFGIDRHDPRFVLFCSVLFFLLFGGGGKKVDGERGSQTSRTDSRNLPPLPSATAVSAASTDTTIRPPSPPLSNPPLAHPAGRARERQREARITEAEGYWLVAGSGDSSRRGTDWARREEDCFVFFVFFFPLLFRRRNREGE